MTDQAMLATELEAVAQQVTGVRQLYLAGSTVGAVVKEGAQALGIGSGADTVQVTVGDDSCTIEVACAVASGHKAGDVARELVSELTKACQQRDLPDVKVVVTISQVSA